MSRTGHIRSAVALLQAEESGSHTLSRQQSRHHCPQRLYLCLWSSKNTTLGVSAALLTFTRQGISVLQSWWRLTNLVAKIRKKLHKWLFFPPHLPHVSMFLKESKQRCRVSSSCPQLIKFVHILGRAGFMPCEELFSECIDAASQS